MKQAFLILLCVGFSQFAVEESPGVKYSEVRAYAWDAAKNPEVEAVILEDMKLRDGAINKDGALLSAEQVKRLLAAVTGDHAKHPVAECYEPHNAFVFYDSEKKPVAYVEICFDCLANRTHPRTPGRVDLVGLATIFGELKLPIGKSPDAASFEKRFSEIMARKRSKEKPAASSNDTEKKESQAK